MNDFGKNINRKLEGLEEIEALSPDAAEYIELFADVLADFNVEPYISSPDLLANCFPNGLEEDQNEIIYLLKNATDDEQKLKQALEHFSNNISDNPVLMWGMREIFDHFKVSRNTLSNPEQLVRKKFRAPNIVLYLRDQEIFYSLLGLVKVKDGGKGSHMKWEDPKGEFKGYGLAYDSDRFWLKNEIKRLLDKGMPIDKIAHACYEMNIDFEEL